MIVAKYPSKLVGVSFEGRQDTISDLVGNEPLRFRREPENEYDKNAVAVDALVPSDDDETKISAWAPVGYIAKDKNTELSKILDEEKHAQISLKEITGGGDKAYGINVEIEYEKPFVPYAPPGTSKREKDIFGNEIDYDAVNHVYSWNGEIYESGSQYAKSKQRPFDKALLSGKVAKKAGVDPNEVAALWELGGQVSRDFGTTVHLALEVYGLYRELSEKLGKEYHIPNHPVLKSVVESFYEGRDGERAKYEALVVDHKAKRAGRIDRLVLTAPKTVTIQDYKITHKEDKQYWTDQLGFYQGIIEANGWKVSGKEIHRYNDKWKEYKV